MSKPITIRVPDEVHAFFVDLQSKKSDTFFSDTVKNYFNLNDPDVSMSLNIGSKDKQWMILSVIALETLKVAEGLTLELKENSNKSGYTHLLNYMKNTRIKCDILCDTITEMSVGLDLDILNRMFDFAVIMAISIEKASKSPRQMEKLVLALTRFTKEN